MADFQPTEGISVAPTNVAQPSTTPSSVDGTDINSIIQQEFTPESLDPKTWGPLIQAAAQKHNVPAFLIKGIIGVENSGGTDLGTNPQSGATGIGQFMPGTAKELNIDSMKPSQAIDGIAKYLRQGFDDPNFGAGKDWLKALQFYQGGPNKTLAGPQNAAYPGQVLTKAGQPSPVDSHQSGDASDPFSGVLAGLGLTPGDQSTPAPVAVQAVQNPQVPAASAPPTQGISVPPPAMLGGAPTPAAGPIPPTPQAGPTGSTAPGQDANLSAPTVQAQGNAPQAGPQLLPWGNASELAHQTLLGADQPLMSGMYAGGMGIANALKGQPLGQVLAGLPKDFQANQQALDAVRNAWVQANPGASLIDSMVGQTAGTVTGMGLAGKAIGAGGRLVASELPEIGGGLQNIIKFFAGHAGQEPGVANTLVRATSKAASGGLQGGTASLMTNHLNGRPLDEDVKGGAELGAAISSVTGPIGHAFNSLVNAGMTERNAALALTREAQFLQMRPGQMAQGGILKQLDKNISQHVNNSQLERFTHGIAPLAGQSAGEVTTHSLNEAARRLGDSMGAIAGRIGTIDPAAPGGNLFSDLSAIVRNMRADPIVNRDVLQRVARVINGVRQDAARGITGERYQALTRAGSPLSLLGSTKSSGVGTDVSRYARDIRSAIDDALARTVQSRGNPEDWHQLQAVRSMYRNNMLLQSVAAKSPSGILDPTLVQGALNRSRFFGTKYNGPLRVWGELGQFLSKPSLAGDIKTVGPIQNIKHTMEVMAPALAGGLAGASSHFAGYGMPLSIAAGAGGYMAHKGMQSLVSSPAFTNRLADIANGTRQATRLPNPLIPLVNSLRGN